MNTSRQTSFNKNHSSCHALVYKNLNIGRMRVVTSECKISDKIDELQSKHKNFKEIQKIEKVNSNSIFLSSHHKNQTDNTKPILERVYKIPPFMASNEKLIKN